MESGTRHKSYDKRRHNGKCFYCKKTGHKDTECRKKKADEERRQVARETSDYAFTSTSVMGKTEWLVDSGASSHMTSVRDKFVSMKELKTPVRITIADGRKIDAVAMGTVGLKPMDGTSVTLSDVLYIPEVDGSLISVAKLAEKDIVAQFCKDKCVFRYGDATVMEAKRCGNVYKLKTVGDEVCRTATTSRKEPGCCDDVCAGCCMGKMRADDYPRHPEKLGKSAGLLDLVYTDVMGPMQTKTPGGCTFGVTFIDDYSRHVTVYFMKAKSEVLSKFKIYKAAMENATDKRIKRLRSDNGGEYTDKLFKAYLNRNGIKHEKTVPYTPQQNGLAERLSRSLVETARCLLYHEGVDKKWWAESVNTAAWIINRIPNSVNTKTPYEIVNKAKPQLKNLKVFGSLGYAHIPDAKRRKLDAKAFRCRFLGYEDGVKGYRVLNVATGKVQIVRTVKFMETTNTDSVMVKQESEDNEGVATEPSHGGQQPRKQKRMMPTVVPSGDVISLQRDAGVNGAIVPYESTHPMTTRSRSRPIEETTDPEEAGARKKQVVASSTTGTTKRQRMVQGRAQADDDQLTIEGGQAMAPTEDVPKTNQEATASTDHDEWKNAMKAS
ncbi:unnamed protein product [Phytophthora fragariaefolia]|uniref:Unnamed protein product n=1 Tax=Phytophthora fragariaefolia TaxID=1490495 RepID=A0A9W6XPS1_9STRA|nr:unnamed protein product [Phytophthora fragariaefolia]